MKIILKYEFLLQYRNKTIWLLTIGMLFITMFSLYKGRQFYIHQTSIISELKAKNISFFNETSLGFKADTTTIEGKRKFKSASKASWGVFSHRYNVYWVPQKSSILCIGSRDVYPFYQELMPLSLYMRLFKNEISNPLKLMSGNIDFSFVIVFLLPLFIIALTFSIVADDKQLNLFPILEMVTSTSTTAYYAKRFLCYALFVSLLLLAMFLLAIIFLFPFCDMFLVIDLFLFSLLYSFFWLIISFAINMMQLKAVQNIGILIGLWLMFTILIPSIANQIAIVQHPIDTEEITNTVRRVQLDSDKKIYQKVLKSFFNKYPQYDSQDTSFESIQDKAYIAEGQLNDIKGDSLFFIMEKNMIAKEEFLNTVSFIDPCMLLQNSFSNTAQTNLKHYVAYMKSLQAFNIRMKAFYYERIFKDNKMTEKDYKNEIPIFCSP